MKMKRLVRLTLRIAALVVGLLVAALALVVAIPQSKTETQEQSDGSIQAVASTDSSEKAIAEENARIDARINDLLVYDDEAGLPALVRHHPQESAGPRVKHGNGAVVASDKDVLGAGAQGNGKRLAARGHMAPYDPAARVEHDDIACACHEDLVRSLVDGETAITAVGHTMQDGACLRVEHGDSPRLITAHKQPSGPRGRSHPCIDRAGRDDDGMQEGTGPCIEHAQGAVLAIDDEGATPSFIQGKRVDRITPDRDRAHNETGLSADVAYHPH